MKEIDFEHLTIFQPALLLNRRNDERTGEKIAAYIPFLPSIEAKDLGVTILNTSWLVKLRSNPEIEDYGKVVEMSNSDCKSFAKTDEKTWLENALLE